MTDKPHRSWEPSERDGPITDEQALKMADTFSDLVYLLDRVESDAEPDLIAAECHENGWDLLEYLALALTRRGYELTPPGLFPAEQLALTVALEQVLRGDQPTPNITKVCVLALARFDGRRAWSESPVQPTEAVPRGTLALVSKAGVVVVAASFRLGNPDDLNEAVRYVNEDRRGSDRVARYVNGEAIRVGHQAPRRSGDGDCSVCDGDHDPLDSHGSSA